MRLEWMAAFRYTGKSAGWLLQLAALAVLAQFTGSTEPGNCGQLLPSFTDIIWKENYAQRVNLVVDFGNGKKNRRGSPTPASTASSSDYRGAVLILLTTGDNTCPDQWPIAKWETL